MNNIHWKNIRMVPILHNRMEFAVEVRTQFKAFNPDAVAVEYPDTLESQILAGVKRLPLLSVVHYEESDGTFTYLLIEPTDGQVEAVRLALEKNIPIHFIDRDQEGYPFDRSPMPDPYAVKRIGHHAYCAAYMNTHVHDAVRPEDILREKTMAYALTQLNSLNKRVLFVGGLSHVSKILNLLEQPQAPVMRRRLRKGVGLAHLHSESSREIMSEMPYLAAAFENTRNTEDRIGPDRLLVQQNLIRDSQKNHWKNNKEELSLNQTRIMNRFARNYALITGQLVPSFYQLIIAARGAVNDNFAYEFWEKGSEYPFQTDAPGLPVLRLEGEDLFLDQKKIRFHRQMKTLRTRLVSVPVRKKKREKYPGQWREGFQGSSICSYPPEDVVIEEYGRYLKKRALEIKSDENSRVTSFISSMEDGLDVRETLRDVVHEKLYVKERRPFRGKIGSVVLIFNPDHSDINNQEEFPWKVTWLGEHAQESDMAFYSTPAGNVMDGPGISRCQYGGFLLSYPPMRMYDIWRDPFFDAARNKPERLLMAALDYSLEKHVVFVAAEPPSGWCKTIAASVGKTIIYLPIGTFSPVTLRKIKTFHVLDGHPVRKFAGAYIQ